MVSLILAPPRTHLIDVTKRFLVEKSCLRRKTGIIAGDNWIWSQKNSRCDFWALLVILQLFKPKNLIFTTNELLRAPPLRCVMSI